MTLEYTYLNEAYSNVTLAEAGPSFNFSTRPEVKQPKKKFNESVLDTVIEVEEPPPLYTETGPLNSEQYFKQLFTFRTWKEFFMCGRKSVIHV
jgi:hypothetical protein